MAQISYGTITIIDTTDIERIYPVYCKGEETTAPALQPLSNWSEIVSQAGGVGDYIWQRIVTKKQDVTVTINDYSDAVRLTGDDGAALTIVQIQYAQTQNENDTPSYGNSMPSSINEGWWLWVKTIYSDNSEVVIKTKQGQKGDQGYSVTNTRELYYLKTNSTAVPQITNSNQITNTDRQNGWTSIVPSYVINGNYYTCIETTLNSPTNNLKWSAPVINNALTDTNKKASEAYDATVARDTEINALKATAKYYWWDSEGAHIASGLTSTDSDTNINHSTPNSFGYNALMAPGYLALRYQDKKFMQLSTNSLTFYKPKIESSTFVQGNKAMELSSSGLVFYDGSAADGGNIQAQFGGSGAIQSGDYAINAATDKFSTYGTKIDLVHGEIYSPYFRLSQGTVSGGPVAGIYISGTFEATGALIGYQKTSNSDTNAYWKIGYMTDTNQDKLTYQRADNNGFIELAPSATFILQKNKIHTGWFGSNGYLTYPQLNSKYYDFGMNLPTSLSDKFLYIRYNSGSNLSTIYQNDSGWTYPFYVDAEGKVHAQNFYIGDSTTPIGGGSGTIAEKLMSGAGSATQPVYFRSDSGHVGEVAPTTYALNAAGAKGVDTSMPATATDNNVPTTKLMKTFVEGKGYITGYTETDPTVPNWAKASSKPSYALSEITSADDIQAIEALTGTSGFLKKTAANTWTLDTNTYLTSYTESDPTVPNWAKQSSKPSYGLTEISGTADLQAIEALTGTKGFLKKTNSNTWTLDTNTYLTSYTETDPIFTASAAADITSSDITNWNGKTSNVGTVTSVKVQGSNGLTGNGTITSSGTITISHADTSSQASSSNSGRTYIQSIVLDDYGHVTSLSTATESVTDTHYTTHLYAGKSDGSANAATTNGNTYLMVLDNTTVRDRRKISGSGAAEVTSDSSGNITISSPIAITGVSFANGTITFTKSDGNTIPITTDNFVITQATGATALVKLKSGSTTEYEGYSAGGATTAPVYFDSNGHPTAVTSIPWNLIADEPSSYTPSSHTHGNLSNEGKITTTTTIANGDKLVIVDTDSTAGNKITGSSITFGTSTTTFLTNKGTWATPVGTTYTFDGTYNASSNKAATVSTVTNAINALDGGTIGTPSASKTVTAISQTNGNISVTFGDISITKSQISDFPTELTPASHTHGNIQNNGTLQTNDITIASGDKLVVTDSSNSDKIARASLAFTSSTTKFLREDGQFATPNYTTNTDSKVSSSNSTSKLYLVGTTSQNSSGQTGYSNSAVYATDGALVATTYNGLTLTKATTGFTIAGGTTSKTLTVNESYTLGAACAKGLSDSSSASAIGTGTNVTTERDIYYGLPTINNSHTYTSSTAIYAPTVGGTANTQALVGNGTTTAPKWVDISPSISITAGTASATPKINVTVLGQSGTAQSLTTASTSVYGATKLSSTSSSTEQGLAATPKLVYDSINSAASNYVAKSGDTMTGTLTTPELITTKLTAEDVNVTHLLTAEGIQTKNWTATNMSTIDGSFYICPTISCQTGTITYNSGGTLQMVTGTVNNTRLQFDINSLFISKNETVATWTQNSLVMITGEVLIGQEYCSIGTIRGKITATSGNPSTTSIIIGNLTTNITTNTSPKIISLMTAGTAYTFRDLKISLYSYYNSSKENLLGIMMTTAGAGNRTYIDIYNGANQTNGKTSTDGFTYTEPVVRIGNLNGLNSYVQSGKFTVTPKGWGIYTTNGFFVGDVYAENGYIGGFTIGATALYNGSTGINNTTSGVYLGYTQSGSTVSAAGLNVSGGSAATTITFSSSNFTKTINGTSRSTLRVAIGSNFGMDSSGNIYANGANITNINASNISTNMLSAMQAVVSNLSVLRADMGSITAGSISRGNNSINFNQDLATLEFKNASTWTSATQGIKYDSNGLAVKGAITATSLTINNTDYLSSITSIPTISTTADNASYSVEIKVTEIDYLAGTAKLVAVPTYKGGASTGQTFTWYKNAINTAHGGTVTTTTNTNDTLSVSDLNAIYIAVLN